MTTTEDRIAGLETAVYLLREELHQARTEAEPVNPMLSPAEVAELVGCSTRTVEYARDGKALRGFPLKTNHRGSHGATPRPASRGLKLRWRYHRDDVVAWQLGIPYDQLKPATELAGIKFAPELVSVKLASVNAARRA